MDKLQAMATFCAVAEHSSFAAAARAMNMTPPVVTRAVGALEDHLGVQLLVRTTRQVRLTEAGARYLENCQRILADVESGEADAIGSHSKPSGMLNITASVLFGKIFVLPALLEFLDANPAVSAKSLFVDRVVNLIDEGVDVAVRIGPLPDSSLKAIKAGSVRRVVCASPDYLQNKGIPLAPNDLKNHRIIAATGVTGGAEWRFSSARIQLAPQLSITSNEAAIEAAERGWGLTRVLSYQIAPQLIAGKLKTVLTDFEQEALPIHVLHAHGARAPSKVRLFVDKLVDRLRANPSIN
jgi:DNA-binding transcriptional LysR family regulator